MTRREIAVSTGAVVLSVALAAVLGIIVFGPWLDAAGALAQTADPDHLDNAGRIIGSPAAGPDPEHSGDRGGAAQLLTLAVMMGGVAFIAWRIRAALRRA